ncbi:MAG: peptide ABC transporter substrate-binding protein [Peptococcaceae bacterium]|nr:peptide ABC transporter substrate-binding protein [Peptococcaceae bacterium]
MRIKRGVFLVLVVLSLMALAGCGVNESVSQIARYNVCTEPETLDSAKATGQPEGTILTNMYEGLVRYGEGNKIIPGIAKEWQISPDGLVYTFKLRESKWSNGDPLTAEDFVYSWRRVLNPDNAFDYAYQLYYIKGAEDYNSSSGKVEDVGIKALDPLTLQVELRAPAPQFLGLTAFMTMLPINPKMDQQNKDWPKKIEAQIVNGPFKPVSWEHNQKIELVRNDNYWDATKVKLDKLDIYLIDNIETGYNMYSSGQLDFQDEVPIQELPQLIASKQVKIFTDASTYFYRFNTTSRTLSDLRVRKALAMSINRQDIVDKVTQAGQIPAYSMVPFGLPDYNGQDFRQTAGNQLFQQDIQQAKVLIREAGYPEGKGLPKIRILVNTSSSQQKVAQAIQQMWKENLGVEADIDVQEWTVFNDSMENLDYDVCASGWAPDYLDPMTFIDLFITQGGNNLTGWSSKTYDDLVAKANSTGDQKIRMEAMHSAEAVLIQEMPVMPIYFYTNPGLIKDSLKGVIVPPFAIYADFKNAYIE